jgi:hypothetical protein
MAQIGAVAVALARQSHARGSEVHSNARRRRCRCAVPENKQRCGVSEQQGKGPYEQFFLDDGSRAAQPNHRRRKAQRAALLISLARMWLLMWPEPQGESPSLPLPLSVPLREAVLPQ